MKIKSISELNEAKQAPAKTLFKMVVKGSTSEIEGVKISKEMAQAALDWFDGSVYARKYEKQVKTAGMGAVAPLIFGDNWGIKKRIPSKLKAEFKELQSQYKRALPENESVVNEGQFSWMTYDTDVQIGSERENTIDVYMFDNEGNQWHEKKYDGYGVFGNMDYYELLAKMNGFTEEDLEDKAVLKAIRAMGKAEMRDIGIALAFDPKGKKIKTKAKGNKVLFPALVENPKFDWKRHDFSEESESDPNQSWYQEPDYDEDYDDDEDYEHGWYESNNLFPTFNDYVNINEDKFSGIADLVKSLHFEIDPKTAEEKKIEIGYRQGEVTKRKQIEGGEYSLRRFRKEIKYGDGTYLGVFTPGSYDAAVSSLGDGPHAKKVKKVKWNQRKYDKWVSDLAYDNDGGGQDSSYGFEMAQNAKHEPGLIDFVKRSNRGEDPLQRIQWDIEAAMESVNEAYVVLHSPKKGVKPVATAAYADKKDAEKWAKDLGGITMIVKKKIKGIDESVNEAKVSLEKIKEFASKHLRFLSTSEEFDGTEGGLWASAEDGDMYKGKRIYDYYSEDYKNYTFGVLNKWENELNKRGYYSEYYDAGTVMIWEL